MSFSGHCPDAPCGLVAGENAHGQAATAFASVFMVVPLNAVLRFKMRLYAVLRSSASSCSRSHMVACSSASRASSFSSSVRLWLLMNRAMLSAVCCCLFTFCRSPFCLCIQHHVIMPCSVLCLDSERFSGCLMFIRSSHRGCRGKALTRL